WWSLFFGDRHQQSNSPQSVSLLCASRRERPRCRTTNHCDEFASFHHRPKGSDGRRSAQSSTLKPRSGCPLWVINGHFAVQWPCPLYRRKQKYAVQKGMSAMGQKRKSSARQSSKDLSEASPIVSSKPFDLIVGQPRGDQPHAAIDVIATLPRRIELELLNEIFVALLCEHRRFDRAAGTGPMTGRTGRYIAVRITELHELNDRRWRLGKRDRVEVALRLARIIRSNIGDHGLIQSLGDVGHERIDAASGAVVVQLLVNRRSRLPRKVRIFGRSGNAVLPVTG